jgi:hypothetical protein
MPRQPEPPSVVVIATFVEEVLDRETALAEAAASVTSIPDTDKDADRASGKEF